MPKAFYCTSPEELPNRAALLCPMNCHHRSLTNSGTEPAIARPENELKFRRSGLFHRLLEEMLGEITQNSQKRSVPTAIDESDQVNLLSSITTLPAAHLRA